jgi:hypothetical protein
VTYHEETYFEGLLWKSDFHHSILSTVLCIHTAVNIVATKVLIQRVYHTLIVTHPVQKYAKNRAINKPWMRYILYEIFEIYLVTGFSKIGFKTYKNGVNSRSHPI